MINISSIGERIRKLRKEKHITQAQLAEKLQLSTSTIAMYETNRNMPDPNILQRLADFFDTSIDYLIGRTDIKERTDTIDGIIKAIADDPELIEFVKMLQKRREMKLFFKQTKNLSPETIKQVIRIIKAIEDEETNN